MPKYPYNKPVSNLPGLPDELWLRIFEVALGIDEVLDVSAVGAGFPQCPDPRHKTSYRSSLRTRTRIVSVCKLWNELARPLLCIYLCIPHSELSRWLTNLRQLPVERVKRLDLLWMDTYGCDGIAELLTFFPNLQILVFAAPWLDSNLKAIQLALKNGPGSSLRALSWYLDNSSRRLSTLELSQTLEAMPNLRALRWQMNQTFLTYRHTPTDFEQANSISTLKINLPHLQYLRLPHDSLLDPLLLAQTYPNLTTITCLPSHVIEGCGDKHWHDFVLRHAPQLRHIQIHLFEDDREANHTAFSLLRNCQNFVRFDVLAERWTDYPPLDFPPSVTTLGVCAAVPSAKSTTYDILAEKIEALTADGLRTVQFLRRCNWFDMSKSHAVQWKRMSRELARRGIEMLDHEGKVIPMEADL